jgi:CheY-like chemotaxis protein
MPKPRVLVVDDNLQALATLAALLELTGHEVDTAPDGQSALALARSRHPQVIVIDLALPDIPGEEVARRLRAEPQCRHATLIALTGRELSRQPDAQDSRHLRAGSTALAADASSPPVRANPFVDCSAFDHALQKPAGLDELLRCFSQASSAAQNPTA